MRMARWRGEGWAPHHNFTCLQNWLRGFTSLHRVQRLAPSAAVLEGSRAGARAQTPSPAQSEPASKSVIKSCRAMRLASPLLCAVLCVRAGHPRGSCRNKGRRSARWPEMPMALAAPCQLSVCIEVQPEVNRGSLTGGVWNVQLCALAPSCTHHTHATTARGLYCCELLASQPHGQRCSPPCQVCRTQPLGGKGNGGHRAAGPEVQARAPGRERSP